MRCPFCNHPKIIVDHRAPIGGSYTDENGEVCHRLRCEACRQPIIMREVQPYREPRRRGKMQP